MFKSQTMTKPFYTYQGGKVSDRSYNIINELPFTSCKILHQLISNRRKFDQLVKAMKRLGLNLSGAGR